MTLSLYLARRFLLIFLAMSGVFLGLLFLIELVDHVRRLAGTGSGIGALSGIAALRVPQAFYQILPLVTVLAGLMTFLGLARNSEIVVARSAGRSSLRIALPPALAALVMGLVLLAVFNPIVATTADQYRTLDARLTEGRSSLVSVSDEGLWLREGQSEAQLVIRATGAVADGTELTDVTFLFFDPERGPVRRIAARSARLEPGGWAIHGARDWDLTVPNPQAERIDHDRLVLPSALTTDEIRDSFISPVAIGIWNLPRFIANLEQAGFSARAHRVWLQTELALPLMLAAMVMLGAGFGMRHVRAGGIGTMVGAAVMIGFGLHFMRNFAQILGEGGQIPIAIAAWSVPLAALLGATGLILIMEDK